MFKGIKNLFSKTKALVNDYEDIVEENTNHDIQKIIDKKKQREVKFVEKVDFEEIGGTKPEFEPKISEEPKETTKEIQEIPVKETTDERTVGKLSMAEYYRQKYEERINK